MSVADPAVATESSLDLGELFLQAERTGLRLAIVGRTVALVLLGAWLVGTRAEDPSRAIGYAVVMTTFAIVGLCHYVVIGTRSTRSG
jgi:adenylate cyclase